MKLGVAIVALLTIPIAATSNAHADDATVTAEETSLHTAPFQVPPISRSLKRGARLEVSPTSRDGWRFARLAGGVQGYVRQADLAIEATTTGAGTIAPIPRVDPGPPAPPPADNSRTLPGKPAPALNAVPAGPTAPPPELERRWYARQMALVYGSSALLVAGGVGFQRRSLSSLGFLGVLLAPPVIHIAHRNAPPAVFSVIMRVLLVSTAVAAFDNCFRISFGGPAPPPSDGCKIMNGILLGELIAMPILDIALAFKMVPRSTPTLGFTVLPSTEPRSLALSFVGRF